MTETVWAIFQFFSFIFTFIFVWVEMETSSSIVAGKPVITADVTPSAPFSFTSSSWRFPEKFATQLLHNKKSRDRWW